MSVQTVQPQKIKKSIINAIMAYSALYGSWGIGAMMSVHGAYLFLGLFGLGIGVFMELAEIVIISILVFQLAKKVLPLGVIIFLAVMGVMFASISCLDQSVALNAHFAKDVTEIIEMRGEITAIKTKIKSIREDIASRSDPYKDLDNSVVRARKTALADAGVPILEAQITGENEKIYQINLKLNKVESDKRLSLFLYDSMIPGIIIALFLKLAQLSMIFIVSFRGIFDMPPPEIRHYQEQPEQQPQKQVRYEEPQYHEYEEQNIRPEPEPEQDEYQEYEEQPDHRETIFEESPQAVNDILQIGTARPKMVSIPGGLSSSLPPQPAPVQPQISQKDFTQGSYEPMEETKEGELRRVVVLAIKEDRKMSIGDLSSALGWTKEHTGAFLKGETEVSIVPFDNFRKSTYGGGRKNKALFDAFVEMKRKEF